MYIDQRTRWKIVLEDLFPELKEAKIKAVVDHEHGHRHNVGEFAASLLQSLAQTSKERAYLPIEITGKRFAARIVGGDVWPASHTVRPPWVTTACE